LISFYNIMNIKHLTLVLAAALNFASVEAHAQSVDLKSVTQSTIETNPDVQVRWNTFKAARNEVDGARGGWRPRVDLNARAGPNRLDEPGAKNVHYTQAGASLTLVQMLFDGFATSSDVSRLSYTAMTRYYEFLDASESTALETVRAYVDVLRYREMVRLAQLNYNRHNDLFKLIRERAQSGAGRRVDLDQATGRLALAESNLITEQSNLNDVTARYQRITKVLPPAVLTEPAPLDVGLPTSAAAALDQAYKSHPAYFAAVENIRAAEAAARRAQSGYAPRVDLRANADRYRFNGLGQGPTTGASLEVVMTMNLYKGGSDAAAIRQQADLISAAQDLRDKSCLDIRQTMLIAYNDVLRLGDQLTYLDRHRQSISTARDAYRQQFDIGQRSLLDLLDTENEHFQAQRAYVDGKFNRYLAQARVFAGEGQLLKALNVARTDQPDLQDLQRNDGKPGVALTPCPTDIPAPYVAVVEPAPEPKAMPMVVAPAAVVMPAPVPRLAQAGEPKKDIADMIDLWLKAWMAKDMQRYLSFYAPDFDAEHSNYSASYNSKSMARASWLAYRKRFVTKPGDVSVTASNIRVEMKSENLAELHFNQDYRSNDYNDKVEKVLQVVKRDGRWLINKESSVKR
jgi:adhesin transport system outer membrane protein